MGFEKREFFLLVVLVLLNSSATSTATRPLSANSDDLIKVFEDWALEHKRVYPTEEEKQRRFENFRATHEFVDKFYEEGGASKLYTVGLNAFADMTNEEFYDAHACFVDNADVVSSPTTTSSSSFAKVYENKEQELCGGQTDWSALGITSAPRDQGDECGSCWAFATAAAVEAVNRQTFGPMRVVPLSVQQLISCDSKSDGCEGGKPETAYDYIESNGGLSSEEDYPYAAVNGSCQANLHPNADHSSIGGYTVVQPQTETALHNALCEQPVLAVIKANSSGFRSYTGGVFSGECGPELDHAVLVVGTFDDIYVRYFKILNSWGEKWGENGYMRIIRDDISEGKCGIAMRASYPTLPIPHK